jgi:hypothetical protein
VNPSRASSAWPLMIAAGVGLGFVYTVSPLTVLTLCTAPLLWRFASRDLTEREKYWLGVVLVTAVTLRLLALAGLFLSADPATPFANLFGDEELFKRRTLWMRNVGLGIPMHGADLIYMDDETGRSSYLYVLAYLQGLVGPAPYGIHLFNAVLYIFAALILYRLARRAYGGVTALFGLTALLFLPSLFTWSISALKEPLYILICAIELGACLAIVRGPTWLWRVLGVVGVVVSAMVLESLRFGGIALAGFGAVFGLLFGWLLSRPRLLLSAVVVVPIVLAIALARPTVQMRVMSGIALGAFQHWGHIATPGYTYKLIDPKYYKDRLSVRAMSPPEAARYVINAFAAFITVPVPWRIESRAMLAFLPEQMIWYVLIALSPIGIAAGLRRDVWFTALAAAHGFAAAAMVALTGGNVGTLVRHRGLVLPYVIWFAALGAVSIGLWFVRSEARSRSVARVEPAWQ